MKNSYSISIIIGMLFSLSIFAQQPVQVGKGSYAEYVPLHESGSDMHNGDKSYFMQHRNVYVVDEENSKPLPTNDWWTQILVDVPNVEGYVGQLWAYPQRVGGDTYGSYVEFPKEWNATGNALVTNSRLYILGTGFQSERAKVKSWHDWGFDFVLNNGNGKEMLVTLANGIPFTFYEFTGTSPILNFPVTSTFFRRDELARSFPYQGDCFGIEINGDHYGIYAPEGTVFEKEDNSIYVRFTGEQKFLSIAVLQDPSYLDAYYPYAFSKPINTEVSWNYNEATAILNTRYDVTTVNLRGEAETRTVQGFIPHHYKRSNVQFPLSETNTYQCPRGKMKMAIGNSFSIAYEFDGLIPFFPEPKDLNVPNPYDKNRMSEMVAGYAAKPGYGADTYWGGKDFVQMDMNL
ncbi:MAG: hypothetical protein IJ270_01385, partial [Paludibacteraceae bacterium]|nr:hypothetical protein [Paludibacteraceae bacterium]